jgi:hypothetical protein
MRSVAAFWSRFVRKSASERPKISVSSPHPISNLRLFQYSPNQQESDEEKRLRQMRSELQDWNQTYWENHNRLFNQEKENFINSEKYGQGTKSAEDLAVFYKRFLDENRSKHIQYSM